MHLCPKELRIYTKDDGLIRPLNSNAKPTVFYLCSFFASHSLLEGALNCCWPAADCIVDTLQNSEG